MPAPRPHHSALVRSVVAGALGIVISIAASSDTASAAIARPTAAAPTSTTVGCDGGYTGTELDSAFRSGATGITGADYARAQTLPDGRVLWVFQDTFVGGDGTTLSGVRFMHNAGLVQDGSCYRVLAGARGSWIGGDIERPLQHWFWPLGSMLTADGRLAQFMAEMHNPNGIGANDGARPVAVWIAIVDLATFDVISLAPAPDASDRPLYGFSITNDDRYHYLYGNCYRQFADPGFVGAHDVGCGPRTTVARVPLGHPESMPEYWNGTTWSGIRANASSIDTRGAFANPMQVRRMGEIYVAVTKVDDWWGDTVVVDVATTPQGPWRTVVERTVPSVCGDGCNTYFAHLVPWVDADGSLLVALSNNAWDMVGDAYPDASRYRPSVLAIALPDELPAPAVTRGCIGDDRC